MMEDPVRNMPIRSLQLMLRALSFRHKEIPRIIPDGIFGGSTQEAVSAFQRLYGLPVTGTADLETFRAIAAAYDQAMADLRPEMAPIILFPADLVIYRDQSHPHVYLVQAMMAALYPVYGGEQVTELSGRIDRITGDNLQKLQEAAGLPATGNLDKRTYHALSALYRINFDREWFPANG